MVQFAPLDEHDENLIANAHPADWQPPTPPSRYNLVVIGGGTAGLVTAAASAQLGAKVALIERNLLGGDCLNYGCVPSKALLRAARACAEVRDAARFGISGTDGWTVDFGVVMARMRRLRASISAHDSARRFRDLGVDVYLGSGSFTGPDRVAVDGIELRFRKAVIATGSHAAALPIPGLGNAGFLTNETIFSLTELPSHLAIIGGGPIGCEMAQAFARFGSRVTLLEVADRILAREDADAAAILRRALERDGVDIHTGCHVQAVKSDGDERVLHIHEEGGSRDLRADRILVAVGRVPILDGLGLEAAGVQYDARRGVHVDARLRTTNPAIYAAGDVCSSHKFTHVADATARIVIANALFPGRSRVDALVIPWCTYTDPEIAHVGSTLGEAEERGIEVETIEIPLAEVDRAVLEDEAEGFLKVHYRKRKGRILGATMVAKSAGETISEITLAMVGGLGMKDLSRTIHPYPTVAESLRKAGDAFNRKRFTPRVEALFRWWLGWSR